MQKKCRISLLLIRHIVVWGLLLPFKLAAVVVAAALVVGVGGGGAVAVGGGGFGAFLLVLFGSPREGCALDGLLDFVAWLVGGLGGHVGERQVVSVLLPRSCD